ncbi:unnamed protein product [Rotaria socialis]|uniref:NAD(P)(+)--arginine ADP-ribosyltransferase n=1 Tax=Rotaria socialis TaxID=392032 RepID=A0A818AND9_9BILA|nr:unnamed protein product [Rotaria socialis]CAF3406541.1 unnamed protein product [Rotaria socialis]CAF3481227.1 unnamed protein product [Rotaria socialis]CAF4243785.1 unnamed protein product [Rotaria socialis]CAF4366139.1 unnamed protein product [Rotaria socialis]
MAGINIKEKPSALRFGDMGTLPKRMLAPIEGYEKAPLVTLEEAVKLLVDIVPKVERNVFVVKQNCEEPEDGLTSDESASIMLYTYESKPQKDSLYAKLNEALRSEQRDNLTPWFLYLRLIMTALARLPSQYCNVVRGINGNLWSEYPKGKTFIWWGFSSCTSSVDVLENEQFFGKTGDRTLFQIECITARDIKNHSFYQTEEELLLLPARQLQVKACLNSGHGLHIIQLKELKPQFDLIEPVPLPNPYITSKSLSSVTAKDKTKTKSDAGAMEQQLSTLNINENTKLQGER